MLSFGSRGGGKAGERNDVQADGPGQDLATVLTQEQTLQEFNSVLHNMAKEKGAESIDLECWKKLKHAYGKERPRGRSTDRAESGEMGGKARSRSGSRAESSGSSDALPGGELD